MARKALMFLTGAVGAAAVVTGAYAARHRRAKVGTVAATAPPVPSTGDNAQRFASEWRADDSLTEERATVTDEAHVG